MKLSVLSATTVLAAVVFATSLCDSGNATKARHGAARHAHATKPHAHAHAHAHSKAHGKGQQRRSKNKNKNRKGSAARISSPSSITDNTLINEAAPVYNKDTHVMGSSASRAQASSTWTAGVNSRFDGMTFNDAQVGLESLYRRRCNDLFRLALTLSSTHTHTHIYTYCRSSSA